LIERELRKKMAQESKPSDLNHQIILFTDQAIPKPTVSEAAD